MSFVRRPWSSDRRSAPPSTIRASADRSTSAAASRGLGSRRAPMLFSFNALAPLRLLYGGLPPARRGHHTGSTVEPAAGRASFIIFVKGAQIGREDVDLSRGPGGWTISATDRLVTANRSHDEAFRGPVRNGLAANRVEAGRVAQRPDDRTQLVIRRHDRHQRDHAAGSDDQQDGSDFGANHRDAEQSFRRVRGARRTARRRQHG